MIDITKEYTTRDGREVRLISEDGTKEYPVVGFVTQCSGEESLQCWTEEGKFRKFRISDQQGSSLDLIPKKKKVKYLKSVPELFEEFPEAYFGKDGTLWISRYAFIFPSNLHLCGATTTTCWNDQLIKYVED